MHELLELAGQSQHSQKSKDDEHRQFKLSLNRDLQAALAIHIGYNDFIGDHPQRAVTSKDYKKPKYIPLGEEGVVPPSEVNGNRIDNRRQICS